MGERRQKKEGRSWITMEKVDMGELGMERASLRVEEHVPQES